MNKDRVTGITLLILGVIIVIMGSQVYDPQLENDVGPRLFPYISGVGLVVCGVGIIIRSRGKAYKKFLLKEQWKKIIYISSVILGYGICQLIFGFLISTPLLIFSAMHVMGQPKNKFVQSIGLSIFVTLAIYLIFERFLHVMLPPGNIF